MVIDTLRKSISYGLLLISIVIYSAGNRTAGDYVFKGAVAALCISVIIALVSKTYKKKTIKETWQLTILLWLLLQLICYISLIIPAGSISLLLILPFGP